MRTPPTTSEVRQNRLVAALRNDDLQRWLPYLEGVDLPVGKVLSDEGVVTHSVYFPITAIVAKLHVMENGSSSEIAVVGSEGVVGMSLVMGGASGATRAVVLCAGTALRMPSDFFRSEVRHLHILHLLLPYIQALISQMSHTAACNRHHVLDQQLCRWLLLSMDRTQGNCLAMTQELMATMLGVRREGVTEAAMKLQRAGLIRYARGLIEIVDRPGLERRACECYSAVRRAYDQLLPPLDEDTSVQRRDAAPPPNNHGLGVPQRSTPFSPLVPHHPDLLGIGMAHLAGAKPALGRAGFRGG